MNHKTQTLIKKLKECCNMQPSSVVLNLVQDQTLLQAARKVGLLGSMDQLLWSERRVEQFMREVFLLKANLCCSTISAPTMRSKP